MLDFKNAFTKGHKIDSTDIETLMMCKNIDFGYVDWTNLDSRAHYNNANLMLHIIDNILDITANDNRVEGYLSFVILLLYYNGSIWIINRLFDNGGVTYDIFDSIYTNCYDKCEYKQCVIHLHVHQKHIQLLKYLTSVSLNKFTKYYNLVKYYDMIHTMLLIIRVQKRVPNIIIKHLIIPFVYQR